MSKTLAGHILKLSFRPPVCPHVNCNSGLICGSFKNPSLYSAAFLPGYLPLLMAVCHCVLLQQWEFKSCQGCLDCSLQHVPVQQTAQRLQTGEINYWGSLQPLMFSVSCQSQFLVAVSEGLLSGTVIHFFICLLCKIIILTLFIWQYAFTITCLKMLLLSVSIQTFFSTL